MIPLNQRETEIFQLVSGGQSYKQVARTLSLSVPTIKFYVKRGGNKLGAINSKHAIALFARITIPLDSI